MFNQVLHVFLRMDGIIICGQGTIRFQFQDAVLYVGTNDLDGVQFFLNACQIDIAGNVRGGVPAPGAVFDNPCIAGEFLFRHNCV